jgi:tetratricopeptide (TPR) repeat protein
MSDEDNNSGVGQVATGSGLVASGAAAPNRGPQRRGPVPVQPPANPAAVDPLVNEGKAALEAGNVTLAELRAMQALQQVPDHLDGLTLLYQTKRKTGVVNGPQVESLLRRIVRKNANLLWATTELAFMLFSRGERVECEAHARNAIRLAPRNAQAHGILGLILTETNRALAGEYHFRKSIELGGEHARVASNLANCLKTQGKVQESEEWYRKASELDPKNPDVWAGWSRLEEARRNIPRAWELLHKAEEVAPASADLSLARAILYGREKKNEDAVKELSRSQAEGKVQQISAVALLERGRLYDKMDRFDDAWADYVEGKRI